MIQVTENVLQFRGRLVSHYALLPDRESENGITLIDGGFLSWTPERTLAALREIGWEADRVTSILLTHGHIDHTRNLARWKELTPARIHAPSADRDHVAGRYSYRGSSRICGMMEHFARGALRYRSAEIDDWFEPGKTFPLWGGIEAISFPGHTFGHTGYYCPERRLLFCGDMFSHYFPGPRLSPPWFTVDPAMARKSVRRAAALDVTGGVLPNHCRSATPEDHRQALERLSERV